MALEVPLLELQSDKMKSGSILVAQGTSLTSWGFLVRSLRNCRLTARKGERPEAIVHCPGILSKQETLARLWSEGLLSLSVSE